MQSDWHLVEGQKFWTKKTEGGSGPTNLPASLRVNQTGG